MRDTAEVFDQHPIDADVVAEQARTVLEDITVAGWKVGFLGSADGVSAVAEVLSDYPDMPLVSYLPNLGWLDEDAAAALPRRLSRADPAGHRGAGGQPQDADRLPAARLGQRAPGLGARAGGGRRRARHALRARHRRDAAGQGQRAVHRQRAGLAAGRAHRREVRDASTPPSSAPATRCRRRWPRCWPPAASCRPPSARRWPSWTRASMRASARAWATSCPTASSGPCRRPKTARKATATPERHRRAAWPTTAAAKGKPVQRRVH